MTLVLQHLVVLWSTLLWPIPLNTTQTASYDLNQHLNRKIPFIANGSPIYTVIPNPKHCHSLPQHTLSPGRSGRHPQLQQMLKTQWTHMGAEN